MGCQGKKGELGHLNMLLAWAHGPALWAFSWRLPLEMKVSVYIGFLGFYFVFLKIL